MLTHPTLDQMQALGLAGMAAGYRQLAEQDNAAELSRDEWLGLMLDREAAMRADRRLTNRLATAKLRFVDACIEDIDFASRRGLDRRNTLQLAQGAWLKAHENFIITGRDWQNLAGVCLRPPGSKARSFCPLFAYAAPVRRPRHGPSRWSLPAPHRQASTCSVAHPR